MTSTAICFSSCLPPFPRGPGQTRTAGVSERNDMAIAGTGDRADHLLCFPPLSPPSFPGNERTPRPHVSLRAPPLDRAQEVWLHSVLPSTLQPKEAWSELGPRSLHPAALHRGFKDETEGLGYEKKGVGSAVSWRIETTIHKYFKWDLQQCFSWGEYLSGGCDVIIKNLIWRPSFHYYFLLF